MGKGSKKQHFVPQLLLRRFADKNERLFVYNMAADKSFASTVRDTGHENHFLSVPALDGGDGPGAYCEQLFQKYEAPAVAAIYGIEQAIARKAQTVLTNSSRDALARFIALQYLRTPAAREQSLQVEELTTRVLAEELATHNNFDTSDPAIRAHIEALAHVDPAQAAANHVERTLQPAFIDEVGERLARHLWLFTLNVTASPLYAADHPVAIHGHADRQGRGLGPCSYGAEVVFPLSSTLQLSLIDRAFIKSEAPELEALDASLYAHLTPANVEFERSLQVLSAQQFVYCSIDDFGLARAMCAKYPALCDPKRARVEATAFGKPELPRRRK